MEVDRRKLYLGMAYRSLWEYLVSGIGYSAPQAQRRIDAARLMVQVPELGEKLESGAVNLSQISILQKNMRNAQKENKTIYSIEQKKEIVNQLENKSLRETQVILAKTFDLPLHIQEIKRPQKDHSTRVEMTFSKEEMDLLSWAQGQLAHALFEFHPDMNLKNLMLYSVTKVLKAKQAYKFCDNLRQLFKDLIKEPPHFTYDIVGKKIKVPLIASFAELQF